MSQAEVYPLTFVPELKHYLWGGRRFETLLGRSLPPGTTAESWEISGHPSAPTRVVSGVWAGRDLGFVTEQMGERLVGTRAAWAVKRHKFPLLVKLLDANRDLSVQVHPGDAYALRHEAGELGKTELWHILHAEDGARMILGLQPGVTREDLLNGLESGTLELLLNWVPLRTGQTVHVPAGTVHALLAGVVVTEIQQNSDTTYRLYDWGRLDADGKPRPLHVEKALDVIDFSRSGDGIVSPRLLRVEPGFVHHELVTDRYFVVEMIQLGADGTFSGACDGSTLEIWGCTSGCATIRWEGGQLALTAVGYVLLPAALGKFQVIASPTASCLRTYLPPG